MRFETISERTRGSMNIRPFMFLWVLIPVLALGATREQREYTQVMAARPDSAHGAELFQRCVQCHGPDGGGVVSGSVPSIAGQHVSVLARQIVQFRAGQHWDMRMEGVASSHEIFSSPQDIADVANYVSMLDRAGKRGIGRGDYLDLGRAFYVTGCESCHGKEGEGDADKEIPRLAGQHSAYLARQIYDAVDNRRPGLARTHRKRLAPLTFEEVLGITDYLSRIGWTPEMSPSADDGRPGP
jgi:cytochrome c553